MRHYHRIRSDTLETVLPKVGTTAKHLISSKGFNDIINTNKASVLLKNIQWKDSLLTMASTQEYKRRRLIHH